MVTFFALAILFGVVVGIFDLLQKGPTDLFKLVCHECVAFAAAGLISAVAVSVPKPFTSWFDPDDKNRQDPPGRGDSLPIYGFQPPLPPVSALIQRFNDYSVSLSSCRGSGPTVVCEFTIGRDDGGAISLTTLPHRFVARVAGQDAQGVLSVRGGLLPSGAGGELRLQSPGDLTFTATFSDVEFGISGTLDVAFPLASEGDAATLQFSNVRIDLGPYATSQDAR